MIFWDGRQAPDIPTKPLNMSRRRWEQRRVTSGAEWLDGRRMLTIEEFNAACADWRRELVQHERERRDAARRRHQRADIVGCCGVVGMWAIVTALLVVHAWAVAAIVVGFVGFVAWCLLVEGES